MAPGANPNRTKNETIGPLLGTEMGDTIVRSTSVANKTNNETKNKDQTWPAHYTLSTPSLNKTKNETMAQSRLGWELAAHRCPRTQNEKRSEDIPRSLSVHDCTGGLRYPG